MDNIWILANQGRSGITSGPVTKENEAGTVVSDPNVTGTTTQKPGFGNLQFVMIGLMLVVFYFLIFRGPRKKQQEHKKMVQTLSKNDRVRTIGGIIGTVVDIKDDEITLKVDESTNTKIKIASSAIGKNMSKD
ncbi:MAG: preprotein translocase subunit YajC [Planctomycetes bacterium]|nr:preprotein translocase subunit YajC [Planctomycetota bacterium]